eukprot:CAMPEP_0117427092 /NCGR_PEP_ID=MMETSP0758-20121206/7032_1 /TAXON_ID=63605 /ORGANISM="Percolomonas cosmopolitus, Strain AE-1 (ATCC 50343)" /LENGTH=271 /DNA_ID=CAMNT_0005212567 /DNA_START=140 /DNA_END=955 /DNA_ORIENTATION=+
MLSQYGMGKINFSGGEPFLFPKLLGGMVKYCKAKLKTPYVSIVSNGSKIKESWFRKYGKYVDMLAISCDSFEPETLEKIGRGEPGKSGEDHIATLKDIRRHCETYSIKFKINTVVCQANKNEKMAKTIEELKPIRWKVFQMLLIEGENVSEHDKRQAKPLAISDDEFKNYLNINACKVLVPEDNETMRNSYLILDEEMRFLNNEEGKKIPTESILDVGVKKAYQQSGFDEENYLKRDGAFWEKKEEEEAKTIMDIEDLDEAMMNSIKRKHK